MEIQRHLGGQNGQGRLVLFTDASNLAQAAVAYWVTETGGALDANLIASKLKVTRMCQHEHIGRLELVAAVMGVRLATKIARAYHLDMDTILYFTDSMAVLYWLSTTLPLTAYAGHRVAQIRERSEFKQWRYVQISQNPSDLPIRGMRAKDLSSCKLRWKGPEFLSKLEATWDAQLYVRKTENAAAETWTIEEMGKQIVLQAQGRLVTGKLSLIQRMYQRLGNVRKPLKALYRLSELLFNKYQCHKFQTTFREWEAIWIRWEQGNNKNIAASSMRI